MMRGINPARVAGMHFAAREIAEITAGIAGIGNCDITEGRSAAAEQPHHIPGSCERRVHGRHDPKAGTRSGSRRFTKVRRPAADKGRRAPAEYHTREIQLPGSIGRIVRRAKPRSVRLGSAVESLSSRCSLAGTITGAASGGFDFRREGAG